MTPQDPVRSLPPANRMAAGFEQEAAKREGKATFMAPMLAAPPSAPALPARLGGTLLDGRFGLGQSPWRVAAGWSLAAALLSVGFPLPSEPAAWHSLLLLFLLVDPVWGGIWAGLTTPRSTARKQTHADESPNEQLLLWLPYMQPDSPAARLFSRGRSDQTPLARLVLPGIALALLLSVSINWTLAGLSLLVILTGIGGWVHRQVSLVPIHLLYAAIAVGLPWLAGITAAGATLSLSLPLLLGVLWSLLVWAGSRYRTHPGDLAAIVGLATAQAGITLLLIGIQMPLQLALVSICWLPTWLLVTRRGSLVRAEPWWLVAMCLSAVALGQS